jgi:phosphoribosyl 1,2-cyclic phosphodiesterase
MIIRFWGTRGSLPVAIGIRGVRGKIHDALLAARGRKLDTSAEIESFIEHDLPFAVGSSYGGNSSCVELVTGGEEYVLCDLGSGLREFGNSVLVQRGPERRSVFNVFLSHLHWDHIMGFPFFTPAYIPGNLIRIHGCHKSMRNIFVRQQSAPCFPVDFRSIGATVEFVELEVGRTYDIAGISVLPFQQNHPNDSYGYRFKRDDRVVVYSTDSEHKYQSLEPSHPVIDAFRDADVLIFDAQYSLAEQTSSKEDWGHSSNIVAVELAHMAGVKHLVMYHHEPMCDDRALDTILAETRRYAELSVPDSKLQISSAYDGLEIVI